MYDTLPQERPARPADQRVLLVEDDDGDAFLVDELLLDAGGGLCVVRARTMLEGLQHLRSGGIDCILLDLGLPDGSGLDVVRRFLETEHVAVVCFTGMDDEQGGAAAVAAGAQDYLVKGKVDGALLQRSIRYAIERCRADDQARQLYATELRAAENARLERGLLPWTQTVDPRLGVTTHYRPRTGELIGGDFLDVIEISDGRVFVLLGDVAGHGPDESALGVSLRIAWRALVLARVPAERVLEILEDVLIRERRSEELFAQASMMVIAPDRRSATLWLAGHLPPMVLDPEPASLPGNHSGPPLGLLPPGAWRPHKLQLPAQWRIMLYTDGLVEGGSGRRQGILGVPGLVKLAAESRKLSSTRVLVDDLLDRVQRAHGGALPDDVAVVALQWPVQGSGVQQ